MGVERRLNRNRIVVVTVVFGLLIYRLISLFVHSFTAGYGSLAGYANVIWRGMKWKYVSRPVKDRKLSSPEYKIRYVSNLPVACN